MNPLFVCYTNIQGRTNTDALSDNESLNDLGSICSNGSRDAENVDDEQVLAPKYEEKMLQLIESCAEKSAKIRIPALKSMCETMQHRYMPDFIVDRKITIIDIIEKSLKKKCDEQELAAKLSVLLLMQTGADFSDFKTVCQILSTVVTNSVCLQSLAMLYFLSGEDISEIVDVMFKFEQIFANCEKSSLLTSETAVQLHVEAMCGFGLLGTLIPPGDFCSYMKNSTILR